MPVRRARWEGPQLPEGLPRLAGSAHTRGVLCAVLLQCNGHAADATHWERSLLLPQHSGVHCPGPQGATFTQQNPEGREAHPMRRQAGQGACCRPSWG